MARVTIKDVAKKANVSTATVSRVLNNVGFVSEEIKKRVFDAVDQLNYQPNAVARSLKQDKTNTIGVVIPDISNPYFMTISKGIEDTIQELGYQLIFCSSDENPEKESGFLRLLYGNRVEAIVLATSGKNEELIDDIHRAGIPIILMDRRIEQPDLKLNLVEEDNLQAAYDITKSLIEQGHTNIGVVNGPDHVSTAKDRYLGYKKAIDAYGIAEDPNLTFNGAFSQEGGRQAVEHFLNLKKKPTAILALNNAMAFGVLLELFKRGYRVPEDMTVASYGEIEAAELLKNLCITSIKQYPYEMGKKIGNLILNCLLKKDVPPSHEVIQSTLVLPNKNQKNE